MTRTAQWLRELIALPSINPAFAAPGASGVGEARVAGWVTATLRKIGLEVESQEVFPQRANVLGKLNPTGAVRQRLVLAPHLDTVGAAPEQFQPKQKQGRLYGRGACDTKGSIAAMLGALDRLARQRARPAHTEILFAGLVDEEHGQAGSRALAQSGPRADLAIVGEPTRLGVVTAHKGDLWVRLETRGKSAHGARPELGRNAIHAMAKVVEVLETDYAAQLRERRHPLLGCATINTGVIKGGLQPNIVPDRCVALADRRTLPGETERSVRRELAALLRRHGLEVVLGESKAAPCLPLETDPAHPWVRQLMRCARQERPLGVDYFCDASVLADAGIPSVVFGPGNIAQAHTAHEWISLRSLEAASALLLRFLESLP